MRLVPNNLCEARIYGCDCGVGGKLAGLTGEFLNALAEQLSCWNVALAREHITIDDSE